MPIKLLCFFAWAGISVYVYVLARIIVRKMKKLEIEDRTPALRKLLSVVSILLFVIALPASVVLFPLGIAEEKRRLEETDARISKLRMRFPGQSFDPYIHTLDDLEAYSNAVRDSLVLLPYSEYKDLY